MTFFGYAAFFIHSSIDGYLGSFHLLTIMKNVAVNIQVQVFHEHTFFMNIYFYFSRVYLKVKLLDHKSVLKHSRNLMSFYPEWLNLFSLPSAAFEGLISSHPHKHLLLSSFFKLGILVYMR